MTLVQASANISGPIAAFSNPLHDVQPSPHGCWQPSLTTTDPYLGNTRSNWLTASQWSWLVEPKSCPIVRLPSIQLEAESKLLAQEPILLAPAMHHGQKSEC